MFRLVICDDHPSVRVGMRMTARSAALDCDVTEVGTAADLMRALRGERVFDLLVLDVNLPDGSGLDLLAEIRALRPDLRIWISSGEERQDIMAAALNGGANGYLPKSVSEDVLFRALRDAANGRIVLPSNYKGPDDHWDRAAAADSAASILQRLGLTPRQQDVLGCILKGYSAKQIARELDISDGTVKTHTGAIFSALGVNSRANVLVKCNSLGIPLGAR